MNPPPGPHKMDEFLDHLTPFAEWLAPPGGRHSILDHDCGTEGPFATGWGASPSVFDRHDDMKIDEETTEGIDGESFRVPPKSEIPTIDDCDNPVTLLDVNKIEEGYRIDEFFYIHDDPSGGAPFYRNGYRVSRFIATFEGIKVYFNSMSEATDYVGKPRTCIYRAIKNGGFCGGYYWSREPKEIKPPKPKVTKNDGSPNHG